MYPGKLLQPVSRHGLREDAMQGKASKQRYPKSQRAQHSLYSIAVSPAPAAYKSAFKMMRLLAVLVAVLLCGQQVGPQPKSLAEPLGLPGQCSHFTPHFSGGLEAGSLTKHPRSPAAEQSFAAALRCVRKVPIGLAGHPLSAIPDVHARRLQQL